MGYAVGVNSGLSHALRTRHGPPRAAIQRPLPIHVPAAEEPLTEILESAILPRLMAAHGVVQHPRARRDGAGRDIHDDIAALVPLAMDVGAGALLDHVDALLRQGVSVDSLFVDLLAPTARRLGVLWEEDRCDFIEVTMGLWRLQEVVRELSARFPPERRSGGAKRALFAAMPGDQHSFGTVMIDDTFRRHGWHTDVALDAATGELIEHVARDWFDVVGLTVTCDCHIEPLPSLIRALRSVSRNPRVVVMVGGRIFLQDPLLAREVGADGTAADAVQAVAVAGGLVGAVEREIAAAN